MKIKLFSQSEAEKDGLFPPPPSLKTLSTHLRRQLTAIFDETFGIYQTSEYLMSGKRLTNDIWDLLDRALQRELPEFTTYANDHRNTNPRLNILNFVLNGTDASVLDVVDLCTRAINNLARRLHSQLQSECQNWGIKLEVDDALDEVDERLREAGTIYRIIDAQIVVSTDDYTHKEIVAPALRVLGESGFENALSEFHQALDAYKDGAFDIVLTKANHAFESTMKIIAGKMAWTYVANATAASMLDVMVTNGLIPPMRDGAMKAMIAMMKSDVPMLRNRQPSAGHGAGENTEKIPEPFAVYSLNATAANIRFLLECFKAKRPKA